MAPHESLAGWLDSSFDHPHLRQLFGRYATYVEGSPGAVPAPLALISHSEARGVRAVQGGTAWSGRRDPANHCCINVATYGPGGR